MCIKLDTQKIFKLADKRSTSLSGNIYNKEMRRNVSYIAIYFKLVAMLIASGVNVPRLLIAKFNERLDLLVWSDGRVKNTACVTIHLINLLFTISASVLSM